jgi:glycerol-3-phosphate dehydrogenase
MSEEMTATPSDFFVRRTGAVYFDINWSREYKDAVINYMADKLNWTSEQKQNHTSILENQIHDAVVPDEVRKAN